MSLFIKYGSIEGEATLQEAEKWVDVDSMNFGVDRDINTTVGRAANREVSLANVHTITVTKDWDMSSHHFVKAAAIGNKGEDLEIIVTKASDAGADVWLKIKCENTLVSAYTMNVSSDGKPYESITFDFTKCELTNSARAMEGDIKSNEVITLDKAKGTVG